MNSNDHPQSDEAKIETMLKNFRPQPGPRFYRRMESAPWNKADLQQRDGRRALLRNRRVLLTMTFVMLAMVAAALFSPALRTMAQQIMFFFLPATSDNLAVQVTVPSFADSGYQTSPENFKLELSVVEELADYPVKQINRLPEGLVFSGAHYDPFLRAVTLRYAGAGRTLLLNQRPIGDIEEYGSIGASAPVEPVQVRGVSGEYVTGGWRIAAGDEVNLMTATPGTQVTVAVDWDPNLPQQNLRWQENGMVYYIVSSSDKDLDKEQLILIAESIQ